MIEPIPIESKNIERILEQILKFTHLEPLSKILILNYEEISPYCVLENWGFTFEGVHTHFEKIKNGRELYPSLELYQHNFKNIFYVNYFDLAICLNTKELFEDSLFENQIIFQNIFACLHSGSSLVLESNGEEPLGKLLLSLNLEMERISMPFESDSSTLQLYFIRKPTYPIPGGIFVETSLTK